ncbi:MAG: hypothetical protein HY974_00485 [Candidatus Kerfeldbacteria bacterium]|nr:hypothetical protein [Candidatus Kerfeldbacteria bacterium]
MTNQFDLNELVRLFTSRGEKVVVIIPGHEPVVLLPLAQYDQLTGVAKSQINPKLVGSPGKKLGGQPAKPSAGQLEAVDPPQGSLEGDDQYFPEPLEPES